jgi:hypothetical protein
MTLEPAMGSLDDLEAEGALMGDGAGQLVAEPEALGLERDPLHVEAATLGHEEPPQAIDLRRRIAVWFRAGCRFVAHRPRPSKPAYERAPFPVASPSAVA